MFQISEDLRIADIAFANATRSEPAPKVSFVIPLKDEAETIAALVKGISKNMVGTRYEILLIDDGSTDASWSIISDLASMHPGKIRGFRFRANRGKAAALAVGLEAAQGEFIFTMDADLQDDPTEIPRFLKKIEEGYDLVSGWKQVRHDPWHKVFPSRIFNRMLSRVSKVHLHDHNCGFKCYRRDVAKSIRLFGELHRMVPALAGMQGFRVTEIPVKHHARQHGKSKYGIERFIRGFSDMLTMGFLRSYQERPSHFTNACALSFALAAVALLVPGLWLGMASLHGLMLTTAAILLIGIGGATMVAGLLSELMIRTAHLPQAQSSVIEVANYPANEEPAVTSIQKRYMGRALLEAH